MKEPSTSTTMYLVLTTRTAGQAMTPRTRIKNTAGPQNAVSARLAMDLARTSTETCSFTVTMNDRGKLSVMTANIYFNFFYKGQSVGKSITRTTLSQRPSS